jgi:hypothetical protein
MGGDAVCRKLNALFRDSTGSYEIYVCARMRPDARWEGTLEFRPVGREGAVITNVQTTQSSVQDVFDWAAGLTDAHLEGSFASALGPRPPAPPVIGTRPTPARTRDRIAHLRPIERDVLETFRRRNITRLPTAEIFDRGPHANADYVRAFEDLEKQGRYLVRHTVDGTDWLELTVDGANALGIASAGGEKVVAEAPKSAR